MVVFQSSTLSGKYYPNSPRQYPNTPYAPYYPNNDILNTPYAPVSSLYQ